MIEAPAGLALLPLPVTGDELVPSSATGHEAQAGTPAPQPIRLATPSLAVLPVAARAAATDAAEPPSRRSAASKFSLVSSTPASDVPAAPISTGPITVAPGGATADASPASAPGSLPVQAPAQAIALPDHRALVEALVRARAERDPGVSVAFETREFGAVALRFEALQSATGERALQVALSSDDPAFDRAVAAASAAQAALADQSNRNPAQRSDPTPTRSGEAFGDGASGRGSQPDQQSHQHGAHDATWREGRARTEAARAPHGEDRLGTARPERRRGAIFA